MARQRQEQQPHPTWQAFAARHDGNPFLSHDPLYALRANVIDAVLQQVPTFFTAEQKDFELDLARTTRHGFCLRRPITAPEDDLLAQRNADAAAGLPVPLAGDVENLLRTPGLTVEGFLEQRDSLPPVAERRQEGLAPILRPEWFVPGKMQEAVAAVQVMLAKFREAGGRSKLEVQEAMRQELEEKESLQRKLEAYAGWLVTNPTYRSEARTLREQWEATVAKLGRFPSLCQELEGQPGAALDCEQAECSAALRAFCHRWCLERLLTWELPLPLSARVDIILDAPRRLATGGGVAVELPWPLLSGSQIDMRAVLRRLRFEGAPEHLRDWVCQETPDLTGEITYHHFFSLYRTLDLVLFRRYAVACKGRIEKLEFAFADILHRKPELVRKVRQKLARALKES